LQGRSKTRRGLFLLELGSSRKGSTAKLDEIEESHLRSHSRDRVGIDGGETSAREGERKPVAGSALGWSHGGDVGGDGSGGEETHGIKIGDAELLGAPWIGRGSGSPNL